MTATSSQTYTHSQFSNFLAKVLRVGTSLRVYHVSTPPTPVAPLYASPPGKKNEPTTCESHFLAVSQEHALGPAEDSSNDDASVERGTVSTKNHVLVLGIEVLIFTTNSLSTIFISKADSTGFLPRSSSSVSLQGSTAPFTSTSIIKTVISAFLEWLVSRTLSPGAPEPKIGGIMTGPDSDAARTFDSAGPPSTETETNDLPKEGIDQSQPTVPSASQQIAARPPKIVLSLFARSQNQYLFPGSIENPTKHVLDDRQLIKWWCRVLDGLVGKDWDVHVNESGNMDPTGIPIAPSLATDRDAASTPTAHPRGVPTRPRSSIPAALKIAPAAYVIVPGCDRSETIRSFFPSSTRSTGSMSRWHNSYPADFLINKSYRSTADAPLPVRCMIPRLPDDPKARYCNDLDESGVDDRAEWRSVRSLPQFWEMMEYRQECAAGRLVGFVWVTFDARGVTERLADDPEFSLVNGDPTAATLLSGEVAITTPPHEKPGPATIVLSADQYNNQADFLINTTDFAGVELAVKSTNDWINKVKELSGAPSFGVDIVGLAADPVHVSVHVPATGASLPQTDGTVENGPTTGEKHARDDMPATPVVNVLTGVRKKRKVAGDGDGAVSGQVKGIQDDTTDAASNGSHGESLMERAGVGSPLGVKTLSAGLIRRTPKV